MPTLEQVKGRTVLMPTSDLLDLFMANAIESILSSDGLAKEFIRGDGITADTLAEKAWELACAMKRIRDKNYCPEV